MNYQTYILRRLKMTAAEARAALASELGEVRQPLLVSYGMGVDSTALLVGLHERGIRPDMIKFADTGGEKQATYDYLAVIDAWCDRVGFPRVTVVHANSKYTSLYDECWQKSMLPSIAYGGHSCSQKWKAGQLERTSNNWLPARLAWGAGLKIIRAIGYDSSPRDTARCKKAVTYVAQKGDVKHEYWYPLREWGWAREDCARAIERAGLPVPPKSSCTFCTAMKPQEIYTLRMAEPDKYYANLALERRAIDSGKLERNKHGELKVKGLGRSFAWAELEAEWAALEGSGADQAGAPDTWEAQALPFDCPFEWLVGACASVPVVV